MGVAWLVSRCPAVAGAQSQGLPRAVGRAGGLSHTPSTKDSADVLSPRAWEGSAQQWSCALTGAGWGCFTACTAPHAQLLLDTDI